MIDGYNQTPDNFGVPSDDVIENVIKFVDYQMGIDQKMRLNSIMKKTPFSE